MASAEIDRFVQTVVNDHGFATGIKSLDSHYALVRLLLSEVSVLLL